MVNGACTLNLLASCCHIIKVPMKRYSVSCRYPRTLFHAGENTDLTPTDRRAVAVRWEFSSDSPRTQALRRDRVCICALVCAYRSVLVAWCRAWCREPRHGFGGDGALPLVDESMSKWDEFPLPLPLAAFASDDEEGRGRIMVSLSVKPSI